MNDVQNKAGRITRNRRIGVAVAALAAVAVIGPAIALTGSNNSRSQEPPVTTQSPSPSPKPDTDPSSPAEPEENLADYVVGRPVNLNRLPRGSEPSIAWAEVADSAGGVGVTTIHPNSGEPFDAPAGQMLDFAPMDTGWGISVGSTDDDAYGLYLSGPLAEGSSVSEALAATTLVPVASAPTFSANGSVAWLDEDRGVHVMQGSTQYDLGELPPLDRETYELSGLAGDCAAGTCGVFALDMFGPQTLFISLDGSILTLPKGREVTSVGQKHFTAVISTTDEGSCSGVFTIADPAGEPLWQTCDYFLDYISPNDDYVLGLPAYLDGLGFGSLDLLNLNDGTRLQRWPSARHSVTIGRIAWESESTFLAATWQGTQTGIVRFGADGSAERASDTLEDPNFSGRFRFEAP